MTTKLKAVLLNAFVLPGLGQLLLGRKIKGFICIMLVNILLLASLFVVLKTISPVIAAQIAGSSDGAAVAGAIEQASGFGKALLAAIVVVWGYALIDVLKAGPINES
jgi:TM2 domain-containing membrane protein YozV